MLRRITTAVVLIPFVIVLILNLSGLWFNLVLGFVFLLGLWEWHQLTGSRLTAFTLATLMLLVLFAFGHLSQPLLQLICGFAAVGWLWLVRDLMMYGFSSPCPFTVSFPFGTFLMAGAGSAMMLLHAQPETGPLSVIAVLSIVWAADSFAYLAGKKFGRNALAPKLSPGKTIEGSIGGMIGALLIAAFFGIWVLKLTGSSLVVWMGCSALAAAISIVGDLYQSRLKRNAGVKDSGSILPGHGGVLDRIDSMISAMPVFVSGWYLLK